MVDHKQEFKLVPLSVTEYPNVFQVHKSFSTNLIIVRLIYTGDDITYPISLDKINRAAGALARGASTRGILSEFEYYLLICLLRITKHETSMPIDDSLDPHCGCAHTIDKIVAWRGRVFELRGSQHDLYWTDPEFPAMLTWRLNEFARLLDEIRPTLPKTLCRVNYKMKLGGTGYKLTTALFNRKTPPVPRGGVGIYYTKKFVEYCDTIRSCIIGLPNHLAELGANMKLYEPKMVNIIIDFLRDADYVKMPPLEDVDDGK